MSGRLLARRSLGAALVAFGAVAPPACGAAPAAWALLLALCAWCAAVLWRRTPADSEWERRVAARTPRGRPR